MLHTSTAYWIYAALITAGWCFSVASICVLRRVKDLPKAVLARDVAFIVLCYIAPVGVGAVAELRATGELTWRVVPRYLEFPLLRSVFFTVG